MTNNIIIYSSMPGNPAVNNVNAAYAIRMMDGSSSKYSAIPLHTPPMS